MSDKKATRKSVHLILNSLTLVGFNHLRGTSSRRGKLLFLSVILIEINLILTMIKNWTNFEQRILAIEDLNVNTIAMFMSGELMFFNQNVSEYLKMIGETDSEERGSYAVVFLLECVMYSYYAFLAFCEYAVSFVIFEDILFEMKIFCVTVERFEENREQEKSRPNSEELRRLLRNLAVHHQMIMRKVSIGQKIFRNQVLYICQGFCIQLCIGAYIIENEQMILMKFKHVLVLAAVTMVLALFCNGAQNLLDKNNEMSSALYNFQWHDKQNWFQKDFQILMMQVCIEPTIKFFGLLKMDQSSISSVFKGAYSYLNIIHSLAEFK
ncbi:hypothetical protein LSTR_LSTR007110 [Laodelphax striatellus]|uniref:Odorant receptor n=1 Tax=Laodelphax striatellus TaxID=195883 RepID=A0A482WFH0_LAOST|nr:hypothetical protein LSTR_LSTR007110 [Laodelphax striatellus]